VFQLAVARPPGESGPFRSLAAPLSRAGSVPAAAWAFLVAGLLSFGVPIYKQCNITGNVCQVVLAKLLILLKLRE